LMGVSSRCKWFTHTSVADRLAEIGMTYTWADKSEATHAFIHISECSFLKRKFVRHPLLDGAVVAPLEIASIHKSLTCTKHQKAAQEPEAQIMALNMGVALYELFQHGEEVFNRYRDGFEPLREVIDSTGYKVGAYYNPPTIEDCIERYNSTTNRYAQVQKEHPYSLTQQAGYYDEVLGDWIEEPEHPVVRMIRLHPLKGIDYRTPSLRLRDKLWRSYCHREKKKRQLRRNARLCAQMFSMAGGQESFLIHWKWSILTKRFSSTGTSRAFNMVEKIVAKRYLPPLFSSDIEEHIAQYLVTTPELIVHENRVCTLHFVHVPLPDDYFTFTDRSPRACMIL